MTQSSLFHDYEVKSLIEGKEICSGCGRPKRAYAKTMDKRLVAILLKAVNHCEKNSSIQFEIKHIYGDSQIENSDFRKLHYWDLVERAGRVGHYRITQKGWKFVLGNIRLPKIVWVWKDDVIQESPETVAIFEVETRWQQIRADYTLDYLPWPFAQPEMAKML